MHVKSITTICALLLLATSTALAQPDTATKEKARDMGLKGLSLFDNGDYAGALQQFEQAFAMYHAPTLGLYSARALAKLGRLTEASARYQEVTKMAVPSDAPEQFRQAKADAEAERVALVQRIPRLRVEVAGASGQAVSVTIDGVTVQASDLEAGFPLNPGAHVVNGQLGDKHESMNVALQEGETRTVTLEFKQAQAPEAAPPAPSPMPAPSPLAPGRDTSPAERDTGTGRQTTGWVLLGVGGVGIGVGAITGLIASGKKSDLEQVCRPDLSHCPESARGDVDGYNRLRTISTVGFVAGGIGLAGGAFFLLTAPKPSHGEQGARLTPWIGLGSAGMRGQF